MVDNKNVFEYVLETYTVASDGRVYKKRRTAFKQTNNSVLKWEVQAKNQKS